MGGGMRSKFKRDALASVLRSKLLQAHAQIKRLMLERDQISAYPPPPLIWLTVAE
jgi:hypothetical protein